MVFDLNFQPFPGMTSSFPFLSWRYLLSGLLGLAFMLALFWWTGFEGSVTEGVTPSETDSKAPAVFSPRPDGQAHPNDIQGTPPTPRTQPKTDLAFPAKLEPSSSVPRPQVQRGTMERRSFDLPVHVHPTTQTTSPSQPFARSRERPATAGPWTPHATANLQVTPDYQVLNDLRQGKINRLALPLPDLPDQVMIVDEIIQRGPHTSTLRGHLEQYPDSDAFIVLNDGALSGSVMIYEKESLPEGGTFMIQQDKPGRIEIQRLDPLALRKH